MAFCRSTFICTRDSLISHSSSFLSRRNFRTKTTILKKKKFTNDRDDDEVWWGWCVVQKGKKIYIAIKWEIRKSNKRIHTSRELQNLIVICDNVMTVDLNSCLISHFITIEEYIIWFLQIHQLVYLSYHYRYLKLIIYHITVPSFNIQIFLVLTILN